MRIPTLKPKPKPKPNPKLKLKLKLKLKPEPEPEPEPDLKPRAVLQMGLTSDDRQTRRGAESTGAVRRVARRFAAFGARAYIVIFILVLLSGWRAVWICDAFQDSREQQFAFVLHEFYALSWIALLVTHRMGATS
jgi:outer membrane biosynthesis protein TonB